jgi:hypothetical protein
LNFAPTDARAGFGDTRHPRLVSVKDRYAPDKRFCSNQNVAPTRRRAATLKPRQANGLQERLLCGPGDL